MVPHVGLGAVQESLELETVRVPVRDDVADLADDGREYEDANQVADYREDVPANQEGRKRADQSEGDVISVLRSWTSGPRRSLPPLSLSFNFSLLSYLPSSRPFLPFFLSLFRTTSYTSLHSLPHATPVSFPATLLLSHILTCRHIHTTQPHNTRSRTDCLISLPIRKTKRATVKRVFCIRSQSRSLVFWLNVIAESMNSRVSLRIVKIP